MLSMLLRILRINQNVINENNDKDAIVIFSSEKTSAYSENIGKDDVDTSEEKTLSFSFDLNIAMEVDAQMCIYPEI
jgi:hypothetical protein